MEAERKAGQLLMVGFEGPEDSHENQRLFREINPFGIILFARNISDKPTLLALNARLGALPCAPLLAIDHEGGRVDRLPAGFTRLPPALEISRLGDPGLWCEIGRMHGRELRAAGFHIDFAPVLDVHTNPDNPVIGDRAFGTTPEEVVHNALPYLQGLTEGGIIGCGKHFPGHGDTSCDSHLELPRLASASHGLDRLRRLEMRPFARAIAQGVPMIMTAHIVCEAIDPAVPATLSPSIIDGILRRELGYRGVVVSDDLEMKAVADHYPVGEAAVAAVAAGCDLVLVCRQAALAQEAHEALSRAIADQELSPHRVAEALERLARLRRKAEKSSRQPTSPSWMGSPEHAALSARASAAADRTTH
jgi:beta-N-acetylhexosaminidase